MVRALRTMRVLGIVPVALISLSMGMVHGADLKGRPLSPIKNVLEEVLPSKPTCGKHGTSVEFVASPKEAAQEAKKEGKLVFVLHVSGHFEDPRFT